MSNPKISVQPISDRNPDDRWLDGGRDSPDAEVVWIEFWRGVLAGAGMNDEQLDAVHPLIKAELADYSIMMSNWSQALYELTGGRLSKPNYSAHVIVSQVLEAAK